MGDEKLSYLRNGLGRQLQITHIHAPCEYVSATSVIRFRAILSLLLHKKDEKIILLECRLALDFSENYDH